jgi:hypothetical protein
VDVRLKAGAFFRAFALLTLSLFLAVAALAAPEWCVRPIGAATREAMWASIQPLIPQMKKIAGKHEFAIISTPKLGTISSNSSAYREGFRRSYITNFLQDKADQEQLLVRDPEQASLIAPQDSATEAEVSRVMAETHNKYSREFVRISVNFAVDVSRRDTSKLEGQALGASEADYTDETDSGKTIGITYVYASSSHFRERVGLNGAEHGATLLTTGDELRQVYDNPRGFGEYLKNVRFVFLDNLPPGASSPLEGPDRVLIRLPAMENGSYADIIGFAHGDKKKRFTVFSLLPESNEAAKPWNLDEHLTRSYVAAGKTIANALKRSRMERGAWTSPETLAAAIEDAVKAGYNPILVGESADDGQVRLAGMSTSFDPETLSDAARKASFFIFCNSSLGKASRAGFSIEGKIYVNAVAELLGTLATDDKKTENSREHASTLNEWLRSILDSLTENAAGDGTKTVDIYKYNGRTKAIVTPINTLITHPVGDQLGGSSVPYLLFLYGAFGGICSEFFRWRALLKRPRGQQYVTPAYVALSGIFVLLAGGVGFVFGRLAPSDLLQTIAAFIAGTGLEEVIKRASRLKSPNVPFDKSGVKASFHEFLSG